MDKRAASSPHVKFRRMLHSVDDMERRLTCIFSIFDTVRSHIWIVDFKIEDAVEVKRDVVRSNA